MAASDAQDSPDTPGPYVLRHLISDIPLSEQEDGTTSRITCVDAWNGNLYIGTSAGEVLHYVSIPPDPADAFGQPSYIFATKLEPPYTIKQQGADAGVKQILLLPQAAKACILCNSTLTFYTLPELSPAFGGKIQQQACLWVGGVDNDEGTNGSNAAYGSVITICLRQRLRLIRIGDEARKIRVIELGGVNAIQRRQDLACVADGQSYSLLDVGNQRKIDLFPISSLSIPEPAPIPEPEPEMRPPPKTREASKSFSSRSPIRQPQGHERNISLGSRLGDSARPRPDSSSPWPARASSRQADLPAQPSSREGSPTKPASGSNSARASSELPRPPPAPSLPPNIVSPTPNEFLLTTGTKMSEPGVGMFVNLEGDVVRGTIEFSSYPQSLVLDGSGLNTDTPSDLSASEGYVLALVNRKADGNMVKAIEAQRWDVDPGEAQDTKQFINIGPTVAEENDDTSHCGTGLRVATEPVQLAAIDVSHTLRSRRLHLRDKIADSSEAETKRNDEEDRFASRFSSAKANVLFYHQDKISWVVRNALITQLERQLEQAITRSEDKGLSIDVAVAQRVFNSVRGQSASNELDFLTLTYIRQKASMILFANLILQTINGIITYEHDKRRAEGALVAGEIDPRIILSLVPPFATEVDEGPQGIWIPQGLTDTAYVLRTSLSHSELKQDPKGAYGDNLLQLIKRYLLTWRKKKGFGSVADEAHVFYTVDAALLHVLLMLDAGSPRGPAIAGSIRAELNDVVDHGVDCFERAKELCEEHKRLYMLSRLYQSRKMTGLVLATWKRIVEGEHDAGGELVEGEQDVRKYLAKLRDPSLVQEYGSWLANRNPKLGVQVFADDNARVKFQPQEAVGILKQRAPGAVKDYLEHLVFAKNHVQYVNDLISFYLDTVLTALSDSDSAAATLLQSYETYRALRPPKPTYRQFITDNAIPEEWFHNRLRLLQLIGGSHGAARTYDVHSLRERLAPYSDELVPEMIILNGREGKHEEALRLLTHGLGDYDTAIRYCLLGGSSIFHPSSSGLTTNQPLPTKSEQSVLFNTLLRHFLAIPDLSERLERTAELLERFGGWFDLTEVLAMIPDEWSVELVSGFLVHGLRRLVAERHESEIVKALSGAQNLKKAVEVAEKLEGLPPTVVTAEISGAGE
ncbi:Vacuolar sorting protein 39 domain 2 [Teratosphaeria destructans]|uniref:Vacuolar sorting protein 39 domain 2 n=1 Tax=Teratosphaeria destructans TaxID=418781 RepID=A0A9W7SLF0_9PEZI|nr:Vacuolar sorting protein 39 domain 2 [Teratosphaeria destructans]